MATKILVVDDEIHVATSIKLALGSEYEVDAVYDGRQAFELLKENATGFSVVITDHMMPSWAGWELINRLQAIAFPGKCIVLSGYLSPDIEEIYRNLGVEYVISKPFDLAQLRTAVAASARAIEAAKN